MNKEPEFLKMLLLLADTQHWLNELCEECVHGLHPQGIKLLNGRNYRLSITAFAHIVERHYYKTMRHPGTGKFTIPIAAIIDFIKEAGNVEALPMKGSVHFKRCIEGSECIGLNKSGDAAYRMVVITDLNGGIVTAYPE